MTTVGNCNRRTVFSVRSFPPSIFIREKPTFTPEWMLHKDYYSKGSVEKKISGGESQGA
jgi:hypothetical protein